MVQPHVGRNDPCPCKSGKKYRQCCWLARFATGGKVRVAPADCTCQPVMLYWVKDEVWAPAASVASTKPMDHLCPTCAARVIGRPITLNDLSVENYLRTARNMSDGQNFIREYVRGTIIVALVATQMMLPPGWTLPTAKPHTDALGIGEQLARQTGEPKKALVALVAEVNRYFP